MPAETRLWSRLRDNRLAGAAFLRPHAIGQYVVDFCAPRHKLMIELDGSAHLDRERQDTARTGQLEARGYRVIRFWNDGILNDIEGVVQAISQALNLV
jgi:very-short-patch-repair endonuclease